MNTDLLTSRFFTVTDKKINNVVFDLPSHWWSRPYEYAWASQFVNPNDIVLDAACGISHPLKFFLLDKCRDVYACDNDPRILSPHEIRLDIARDFGEEATSSLSERYLTDIRYELASITKLPYASNTFDKIFCISVLEHLNDTYNRNPFMRKMFNLLPRCFSHEIQSALEEFYRVLKPGGTLILTFDYPDISLEYLNLAIPRSGLEYLGGKDWKRPTGALYSQQYNIYCYRTVLTKRI